MQTLYSSDKDVIDRELEAKILILKEGYRYILHSDHSILEMLPMIRIVITWTVLWNWDSTDQACCFRYCRGVIFLYFLKTLIK